MRMKGWLVWGSLVGCPGSDDPVVGRDSDVAEETAETGSPAALVPSVEMVVIDSATCLANPTAARFVRAPGAFWPAPEGRDADGVQGVGLAVGDVNDDGRVDVFLPMFGADELLMGDGLGFQAEGGDRLPADDSRGLGAAMVDVDGDGDLDIYVVRLAEPDALYRNDGTGHFTETLVDDGAGPSWGAAFSDIDMDGDLDLLTVEHTTGATPFVDAPIGIFDGQVDGEHRDPPGDNRLWLNDGAGHFQVLADPLPDHGRLGYTFVGGFVDLDQDRRDEIVLVNDFGSLGGPNRAMTNPDGSGWVDRAAEWGLDTTMFGMGLDVLDLNADGFPDFLMSSTNEVHLLVSNVGAGSEVAWFDSTRSMGIGPIGTLGELDADLGRFAWGVALADLDNDGWEDAVATGGRTFPATLVEGWRADGEEIDMAWRGGLEGFTAVAADWGLDDVGVTRGVLAVDVNNDGFLDLIKRDWLGPARLFINECIGGNWLTVALMDEGPNTRGVGARVTVSQSGDPVDGSKGQWSRWVRAGGTSIASGSGGRVHFGVGDTEVVTVTVYWPDGLESVFEGVDTAQHLRFDRTWSR